MAYNLRADDVDVAYTIELKSATRTRRKQLLSRVRFNVPLDTV